MGMVGIPVTGLILPHLYTCPKPDPVYQRHNYVMIFFMFDDLRWEMIVRFVDICRIVEYPILTYFL